MRNYLLLILLGSCALSGCGGGSVGGAPNVYLSTNSLTFGDEIEGTASQPLLLTLTNTGTATLNIASITVSANFAETNNCGSALAAAASCTITVTLAPNSVGSVSGTVSFTDNAFGSPQTVSLSGFGTKPSELNGDCWGYSRELQQCLIGQDPTHCPVGKPAVSPVWASGCRIGSPPYLIDTSTTCKAIAYGGETFEGVCGANPSGGDCSVQGQQCGAPDSAPYCCSGFVCTAGSEGLSCQPATGGSASRARSSWDQGLADRLR